jgi:hypothetical protein
MPVLNNKLGKFFSPSASYGGYVFIACGIFASFYSPLALILLIPGLFMAYTYEGILIDTDKKKLRPYTSLFGIFTTGKWIDANQFTRFNIVKSTKQYTSYSRANMRFDMNISDIELLLINRNGTKKVIVNKYNNFEDAHKEIEELHEILLPFSEYHDGG